MKKVYVMCVMMIVFLISITKTNAATTEYNLVGKEWEGNPTIYVGFQFSSNIYNYRGSYYSTAYEDGIDDWNAAQSKIEFSVVSSSNNVLGLYSQQGSATIGRTIISYSGDYITGTDVEINIEHPAVDVWFDLMKTVNHEFGHVLGLGENNNYYLDTIMKQGTGLGFNTPRIADVNQVNSLYS